MVSSADFGLASTKVGDHFGAAFYEENGRKSENWLEGVNDDSLQNWIVF